MFLRGAQLFTSIYAHHLRWRERKLGEQSHPAHACPNHRHCLRTLFELVLPHSHCRRCRRRCSSCSATPNSSPASQQQLSRLSTGQKSAPGAGAVLLTPPSPIRHIHTSVTCVRTRDDEIRGRAALRSTATPLAPIWMNHRFRSESVL